MSSRQTEVPGTAAMCDFCGKRWTMMDHRWWCHHCHPVQIHVEGDVIYNADEQWLVCQDCNEMVEKKEWKSLAIYSARTHPDNKRRRDLRFLTRACYAINQAFAKAWISSHLLHEKRECLVKLPQVH
jgi:hypothetical protein